MHTRLFAVALLASVAAFSSTLSFADEDAVVIVEPETHMILSNFEQGCTDTAAFTRRYEVAAMQALLDLKAPDTLVGSLVGKQVDEVNAILDDAKVLDLVAAKLPPVSDDYFLYLQQHYSACSL